MYPDKNTICPILDTADSIDNLRNILYNNTKKEIERTKEEKEMNTLAEKRSGITKEEFYLMKLESLEAAHQAILSIINTYKTDLIFELKYREEMRELGVDMPIRTDLPQMVIDLKDMASQIDYNIMNI